MDAAEPTQLPAAAGFAQAQLMDTLDDEAAQGPM